jgi:hypothetical protein
LERICAAILLTRDQAGSPLLLSPIQMQSFVLMDAVLGGNTFKEISVFFSYLFVFYEII